MTTKFALDCLKVFPLSKTNRQFASGVEMKSLILPNGVPQGFALCRSMLLLMNDLEINDNILLYAGDTTLVNSSIDLGVLEMESTASFEDAEDWFKLNNHQLNEDKSQTASGYI